MGEFPRDLKALPSILIYWFEDQVYTLTYETVDTPYPHILKIPGIIKLVDYKKDARSIHDAMNGDHTDAIWARLVKEYIEDTEGRVFLGRNGRSYLRRGDTLKDTKSGLVQRWRSVDICIMRCMRLIMIDFTPTVEKPGMTRAEIEEVERKEFPQFAAQLDAERKEQEEPAFDVQKIKHTNMLYKCLDGY